MYQNYVKSFFDFMAAFIGLIVLSPLIIVITILLFILNNGKPFYFQNRPGYKEKIFRIIKFKTMNDKKNEAGELLPDFERTTLVGKFIRKTSIDEIPQLINVFLGHMSLVGPRPCLPNQKRLIIERKKRGVYKVKPGVTGLAQVSGINMSTPALLAKTDLKMIKQMNLFYYFYYIFITVLLIIRKRS
jgi:lipopolysaccharide/colanic/teichoic acid biosynthesis glycosyltransferase